MNECLDTAVAELNAVGIEPTVEHGGKHILVKWVHNGHARLHTVPKTPSDWRTPLNNRSDLRAILREDGLIGGEVAAIERPSLTVRAGLARVSSLDVARHFARAHKDVLRSIDRTISETGPEFGWRNFAPSSYLTEQSKEFRCYDMTRDGFAMLVMGFTGAEAMRWKLLYIDAFNVMEAELATARAPLERRLEAVEGELKALTDLFFEECAPPRIIRSAGRVRIKPSVLNKWLVAEVI
jgi:Rha family phage regulatory protein